MINHAMFQRNGRSGYVLKPPAIRLAQKKDLLAKRTFHSFEVTIISAQQLPRPRDASGLEVLDKGIVDPYVEVTLYVPDWPVVHHVVVGSVGDDEQKDKSKEETIPLPRQEREETTPTITGGDGTDDDQVNVDDDDFYHVNDEDTTPPSPSPNNPRSLPLLLQPPPPPPPTTTTTIPARSISSRTSVVKKNGFNPVWEEKLCIMFDCVGDMMDLVFVRFVVRQEKDKDGEEPLAVYCASMGSLQCGAYYSFFWGGRGLVGGFFFSDCLSFYRISTSAIA